MKLYQRELLPLVGYKFSTVQRYLSDTKTWVLFVIEVEYFFAG